MIQYMCDACSVVKEMDEVWILGEAAEAVGVTTVRREVTILSAWDWERANHPLAVHFCSLECKDHYMARLFGVQDKAQPTSAPAGETLEETNFPVTKTKLRKARRSKRAA